MNWLELMLLNKNEVEDSLVVMLKGSEMTVFELWHWLMGTRKISIEIFTYLNQEFKFNNFINQFVWFLVGLTEFSMRVLLRINSNYVPFSGYLACLGLQSWLKF